MNLERAFRVGGISLGDCVGVFGEIAEPSLSDDGNIPVGSLYVQAGGTLFQKWRAPDTWIEVSRWPFLFATRRASALDYLPISVDDKILAYTMPASGVVVGLFCQASSVMKSEVDVELWLDGEAHGAATMTLPESASSVYGSRFNLAAPLSFGGALQVRMAQTGGVANDLVVSVLFACGSV